MKTDHYRVYKKVVSKLVRKDGYRLVKLYGCNGKDHRVQYCYWACDEKGRNVTGSKNCVKPDKKLGRCRHDYCRNYGFFIPDTWRPGVKNTEDLSPEMRQLADEHDALLEKGEIDH